MAEVWLNSTATSSTSFNTISIWSTWDDDNNQEIPLGRLPQSGDYIYANGYTCLVPTGTLNLGNAVLSNGLNEKTGRSGGTFYFVNAGTYNITANIENYGYSTVLGDTNQNTARTSARNLIIQGNVYSYTTNGTWAIKAGGAGAKTTINGNLYGKYCVENDWGNTTIVINGSVDETEALSFYGSGGGTAAYSATINGDCHDNFAIASRGQSSAQYSTITIAGTYTHNTSSNPFDKTVANLKANNIINRGIVISCTNLYISGYIYYVGYNGLAGVVFSTISILNPDTFIWKDISEPRINPFIILTDAEMNNRQQYPAVTDVKKDVPYAYGQLVGTFEPNYPPESVVLDGFEYGENMTGTMTQSVQVGCVTKEDVREGVALLGMGEVGTLVVPSADDVREGVVFDNGTIGTLIVQGGGDRLRIADFGYYTNAQSDTYIVDITEADKPKFASAEERILIEMFPTLDLDNIPEMYFDDLFVKYLKYRLIVEYYRTAGVNSTFTPSEPTTEIVNYRNVTCEVWLNSANTYLNAWNKKYDLNESPKKVRL